MPQGPRLPPPEFELFGLESDDWLDRIREAESPAALGSIGPYHLVAEIARGGQGVVYRARQPGLQRDIALERLRSGSLASPSERRRFDREIEAAAALRHPAIVTAYAADVVDAQPVLAMEWIDGLPLSDWACRDGSPRPWRELVPVFIEVCRAVQHAHLRGVIHRDLKPSNILADAEGRPHILDFGLAKLAGHDTQITRGFAGTPAYAAPEQLAGRWPDVDARADIYALGAVFAECLGLAREPGGAFPPRVALPAAPRDLGLVISKAIDPDADRRYASAEAFARDLERVLAGDAVERTLRALYRTLRFASMHRVAAALAALTLLTPLSIAVTLVIANRRLEARRLEALAARDDERAARISAERLASLIEGLFISPSPLWGYGPDMRIEDILPLAEQAILSGLETDPDVLARLHRSLAVAYHGLGRHDKALQHFRASLAEHARSPRPSLRAVSEARRGVGTSLLNLGRAAEARAEFDRALADLRSLDNPPQNEIVATLIGHAAAIAETGDPRAALLELDEALELHIEHAPEVIFDRAGMRFQQAEAWLMLHDPARALEAARLAIDEYAAAYGPGSLVEARGRMLEASAHVQREAPADALAALRRADEIYAASFPRGHPDHGAALHAMARAEAKLGHDDEALALYERSTTMLAKFPAARMLAAEAFADWAELLLKLGRADESRLRAADGLRLLAPDDQAGELADTLTRLAADPPQ